MSNMKSIFKVAEVGSVIKTDLQTKIFTPVYYRIDVLHTCFYKSNCHQKKRTIRVSQVWHSSMCHFYTQYKPHVEIPL